MVKTRLVVVLGSAGRDWGSARSRLKSKLKGLSFSHEDRVWIHRVLSELLTKDERVCLNFLRRTNGFVWIFLQRNERVNQNRYELVTMAWSVGNKKKFLGTQERTNKRTHKVWTRKNLLWEQANARAKETHEVWKKDTSLGTKERTDKRTDEVGVIAGSG